METVTCARCGEEKPSLPAPPWPGEGGQEIHEKVCVDCWREWQAMQLRVINELRLNLGDAGDAATLDAHMRVFLGLADPSTLPEGMRGFGPEDA